MKLQKMAPVVLCMVTSVTLHAQKNSKEKTIFSPPVIVKDQDTTAKGEAKKQSYKSKQWRQGNVLNEENQNGGTSKPNLKKKPGKVPPPPPPQAPPPQPAQKTNIKNT